MNYFGGCNFELAAADCSYGDAVSVPTEDREAASFPYRKIASRLSILRGMGDRAVDCARLESVCAARHQGFESPPIRALFSIVPREHMQILA